MADVYAVFGTLLALGIAFPGMLIAWWLLFPATVGRARQQVSAAPWRCFGLGAGVIVLVSLPVVILMALPSGPARFIGFILIFVTLAFGSLGAAGVSAEMGARLNERAGGSHSQAGAFVRAAVALELAAAFPVIGWFMVIPLTIITAVGAAAWSILPRRPTAGADLPGETAPSQA